jgi:hypothetical protein
LEVFGVVLRSGCGSLVLPRAERSHGRQEANMGKIEQETYRSTTRAMDRERRRNSIRSLVTLFVFIPAVVIGVCVAAYLLSE